MSLPAQVSPSAVAKQTQTKFIDILKTDHNFDVIAKIVDHIGMLERSKKVKVTDKHRMLQTYYLTLLSFAVPKMKVTEESGENKTPINFQININGTDDTSPKPAGKGGVSITIPTNKNKDGSYSVKK